MERLIDRTMKIVKRGNSILVPVTGEPRFDLAPLRARLEPHVDLPHRLWPRDPRHEIRESTAETESSAVKYSQMFSGGSASVRFVESYEGEARPYTDANSIR